MATSLHALNHFLWSLFSVSYLIDRSGFAPELIIDLLETMPEIFGNPQLISELAASSTSQVNYVAFDRELFEPVAVALVSTDGGDSSELTLIAVRPDHQRMSIGAQLLARIDQDLVADHATTLVLADTAFAQFPGLAEFCAATGFVKGVKEGFMVRAVAA